MTAKRFTALTLCFTITLLAFFAYESGNGYAHEALVSEDYIVIENGKVVAGNEKLVNSGLIVIGTPDSMTDESQTDETDDNESSNILVDDDVDVEDYSEIVSDTPSTKEESATSNKLENTKDNSALLDEQAEENTSVLLPSEAPKAVNPDTPAESPAGTYLQSNIIDGTASYAPWLNFNSSTRVATMKETSTTVEFNSVMATHYNITIGSGKTLTVKLKSGYSLPGLERTIDSTSPVYGKSLFTVQSGGTLNINGDVSKGTGYRFILDGDGSGRTGYKSTKPLIIVENGGICNLSFADLRQNYITEGHGAGIYVKAGGTLNMDNTMLRDLTTTGYGGAIYIEPDSNGASATVTIKNSNNLMYMGSTDGYNQAVNGGGIYMGGGTMSISNGYIQCCTATTNGGGIYVAGGSLTIDGGNYGLAPNGTTRRHNVAVDGAGVYVGGGTVSITNASFISNAASGHGGAVAVYGGSATIGSGTTIQGNSASVDGGGLFANGSGIVNITGGDITGNSATQGGGAYASAGGTINMSGGTISSNSNAGVFLYNGAFFNLSGGTIHSNTNSTNYEGCGVAIYHNKSGKFTMSGGTIRDHSGTNAHGVGQTVNASQDYGEGGIIEIKGGTISNNNPSSGNGGGIYCQSGTLTISNGTITGNTAERGGGVQCGEYFTALTISGGTIQGNTATSNGGGVNCESGTVTITNGNITGNTGGYGGGLRIAGNCTTISISGGTIQGNTARSNGGGIALVGSSNSSMATTISGNANIYNNTATGSNSSTGYGGGISLDTGTLTVSGGKIDKNTASRNDGGGIYIKNATKVTISGGAEIINNSAAANGGGIKLDAGELVISGGYIGKKDNPNSAVNGAGIAAIGGTVTMSGTASVSYNSASAVGGGIYINGSAITFDSTGGSVSNNNAGTSGGGIWVEAVNTFNLGSTTVASNTATNNAGGLCFKSGALSVTDSSFTSNTATNGHAGGIWAEAFTSLSVSGTSFDGNTAKIFGGGLKVDGEVFAVVSDCSFTNNKADTGGGALAYKYATVAFTDCTFTGNEAIYSSEYGMGGGIAVVHVKDADKNPSLFLINTSVGVEGQAQNTADCLGGGGVFAGESAQVVMVGGQICNNAATGAKSYSGATIGNGGGFYAETALTISDNLSALNGTAAAELASGYTSAISRPQIYGNSAYNGNGGGIYASDILSTVKDEVTLSITNADIYGNTATKFTEGADGVTYVESTTGIGGGIYMYNAAYTISGCTIGKDGAKNEAVNGGGIVIYNGSQGTITNTTVCYNEAQSHGGGIYIGRGSEDTTTTATITGGSVSYNSSTGGNGGGIFVKDLYSATDNLFTLSGTSVAKNSASFENVMSAENTNYKYDNGIGGGMYIYNTKAKIENCTIGINGAANSATNGGGVAVLSCSDVTVTGTAVNYNTAVINGGGFYVLGVEGGGTEIPTKLNITGGSVSNNVAATPTSYTPTVATAGGAGFYIRGLTSYGDRKVHVNVDGTAVNNNSSNYANGGAFYIHEAANLILKNSNQVDGNYAGSNGGAIFSTYNSSSVDVDNCSFKNNSVRQNGGTFYFTKAGFDIDNVIIEGSKATGVSWSETSGNGGAIYVTNNQLHTPGTSDSAYPNISFEFDNIVFKNCSANCTGGAIYVATPSASFKNTTLTLNNCTFIGNNAVANAGAIAVCTKGSVVMNGGWVVGNHAGNVATVFEGSPYQKQYDKVIGVGGGVAVFGGNYSLNTDSNAGAIYGNLAAIAGDDVFTNGASSSSVTVPAVSAMTIYSGEIPENLPAELPTSLSGLDWYEDYMTDDTSYGEGLAGNSSFIFRYRETPLSVLAPITKVNAENYVSITVATYKNNTGMITISAPADADKGQQFVYTVSGTPLGSEAFSFTISLSAGETVTVHNLSAGTYTVTQHTEWAWRYTLSSVTQSGSSADTVTVNGNVIEFYLACSKADDTVAVTFTNTATSNYWLSHDTTPLHNRADDTSSVAMAFFAEPSKKSYAVI